MSSFPQHGLVVAVCRGRSHTFSKPTQLCIRLVEGLGVENDAHLGKTVKHRSLVRRDPMAPNLRQVHLIHEELQDELRIAGFAIAPGVIGENVTTRGIDLLSLPRGARLRLGAEAVVEITGLRNPCRQLDAFQSGLTAALFGRDAQGNVSRRAGIMGVVLTGGEVYPGDTIAVTLPPEPHQSLDRV
jgi:hypothetical protein